jgi:hypothetical protein
MRIIRIYIKVVKKTLVPDASFYRAQRLCCKRIGFVWGVMRKIPAWMTATGTKDDSIRELQDDLDILSGQLMRRAGVTNAGKQKRHRSAV